MEGIILVDFKASRPNAIGNVHQPDTQQLVIVIAWPVEHHTGTRQGGNVAIGVGCSLKHTDQGFSHVTQNLSKSHTILAEFLLSALSYTIAAGSLTS